MKSDRIFGLVVILVALAYIVSATQIQTSFLSDPVGSKIFPIIIGAVGVLCGIMIVLKPDEEPSWPDLPTFLHMGVALAVLVAYAYALKPFGFLLPTAVAAGIVSYQIAPRVQTAVLSGVGLSVGLFALFKFGLGLGLVALPRALLG